MNNETNYDFTSDWEDSSPRDRKTSRLDKGSIAFLAFALVLAVAVVIFLVSRSGHDHIWLEASCTSPKVCRECGETEGAPLGHNWLEASCASPMACAECGKTEGSALSHSWEPATTLQPSICSECGAVTGRSLGYDLTWCTAVKDSNLQGSTKDVCIGKWTDTFGCVYEDAIRFWVADFGDWNSEEYIQYDIGGQFAELDITIAPEENSEANTRGKILIYCGADLLYESDWVTDTTPPVYATVDVSGCDEIKIVCQTDSGNFHYCIVDAVLYN